MHLCKRKTTVLTVSYGISPELEATELNYPMHDKELLSIKYALVKFRVHLLGTEPFIVYTDHASLQTEINSLHLSPRMARRITFFSEYNFRVEYKPGKSNVLTDALSRRPEFEERHLEDVSRAKARIESSTMAALRVDHVQNTLASDIKESYMQDEHFRMLIDHLVDENLLFCRTSRRSLTALVTVMTCYGINYTL